MRCRRHPRGIVRCEGHPGRLCKVPWLAPQVVVGRLSSSVTAYVRATGTLFVNHVATLFAALPFADGVRSDRGAGQIQFDELILVQQVLPKTSVGDLGIAQPKFRQRRKLGEYDEPG